MPEKDTIENNAMAQPVLSTGLAIRQAQMDDLAAITELFCAYRAFYQKAEERPASHHFLFERLLNHESVIYLAFDTHSPEEKAVGFVQLYPTFSSLKLKAQWVLNDLYVLPDYRKCGVATALINRAKQLVIERRDDGLSLSTAHDNVTAQSLYKTLGFQQDTDFLYYFWQA